MSRTFGSIAVAVVFVAAVVMVFGLSWRGDAGSAQDAAVPPALHTLTGSLEVNDANDPGLLGPHGAAGESCLAGERLPRVGAGLQVVVRNESGVIIGTGSLDFGLTLGSNACGWAFTVADLPETAFYQVQIIGVVDEVRSLAWLTESEWTTTFNYRP